MVRKLISSYKWRAFSLIEILIVGGIAITAGTIIATNLPLALRSTKMLDDATSLLNAHLVDAREKAVSQDRGAKWGVHLDATVAGGHLYKEFYGDSYAAGTVTDTITLDPAISFVSPAQGSTDDVIFEKVTGAVSSTHAIALGLSSDISTTRYVSVLRGSGLVTSSSTGAVPSAPQNLSAISGNAQITLSWTAPASVGGSPIDNYKIYRATSPGFEILVATAGNVLTYTDTGLTNGTAYYYKVSAVSIAGESSLTPEVSATFLSAPSVPQSVVIAAGNTQAVLNWSVPSSNGGSSITNYKIYRSTTSGAETLLTTLGNVLTYTNTGLTNGTTYYYKVSAVNGAGEGTLGGEMSGTPLTIPGQPLNPAAGAGNTQISLTWSAPSSNGGSAITNYKVYRGASSGSETLLTTVGNVLAYTDTGLTNGTTYYYKMSAVNSAGEGAQSGEVSGTSVTAPSAPTNVASAVGLLHTTLTWSAPSSNGGSAVTNYKVYRSTVSGSETLLTTLGNVLTYTNTGLTNGTTYYYKVSAVNAAGEGTQSGEVSGTPMLGSCAGCRYAFATSLTYNGNLGGLSGADAKCQTLADAAGGTGTYKAWLSTTNTPASSRLIHTTVPYKRPDGATVANDWSGLNATLLNPMTVSELGSVSAGKSWTDTNADGSIFSAAGAADCSGWTFGSFDFVTEGGWGYLSATDATWTSGYWDHDYCNSTYHLYCIEQPLLFTYNGPAPAGATTTSPGHYTWTPPAGVTKIKVSLVGGGGGGAGGVYTGYYLGGSGGGGAASVINYQITNPTSATIVVGKGGSGGGNGTDGGTSSYKDSNNLMTAKGGGGGFTMNAGSGGTSGGGSLGGYNCSPGANGTAEAGGGGGGGGGSGYVTGGSGGYNYCSGKGGDAGTVSGGSGTASAESGGGGGASAFGTGGDGVYPGNNGNPGNGYGAGGSGGSWSRAGGAGSDGMVYLILN